MTSQNEEAEELMRRIEKEEERLAFTEPDKQCFHLCIVNLGIFNCSIYYVFVSLFFIKFQFHCMSWAGNLKANNCC